ncbi:MAG TPA: TAXI family TRAP transporter solute-binding subunit [Vicinamibacterales bacterium]
MRGDLGPRGTFTSVSRITATLTLGVLCATCHPSVPAPSRSVTNVRLLTGMPGGGFYSLGERLAAEYNRVLPDTFVQAHPTAGAVANLEALEEGRADLALTFADVAYLSYAGRLDASGAPLEHLRGISVLASTPLHFVVGKNFAFHRMSDLRGRRVGVGPPGSGTALTAQLVFQTFGISPSLVDTQMLSFDDAARRLVQGSLDAMFDSAIYPGDSVRVATRAGARLVPLSGSAIERLHRDYPFFKLTLIPRETYPDVGAIHTIGVDTLLICRSDLDEELVYQLTKGLFRVLPMLSAAQNELRSVDLDQAPATPIPLHGGAARYYRERELLR